MIPVIKVRLGFLFLTVIFLSCLAACGCDRVTILSFGEEEADAGGPEDGSTHYDINEFADAGDMDASVDTDTDTGMQDASVDSSVPTR